MDKRRVGMKTLKVAFLAVVLSLAARTTSYAGPLGLTFDSSDPVMNINPTLSGFTMTFNASTGVFLATGTAMNYNTGSGPVSIAQAFKLTANFSGGVPTSATLTIGLESSPYVSASGLAQFGNTGGKGGTIEFLFNTVGGSSGVFSPSAPLDLQIFFGANTTAQFTSQTGWTLPQTGGRAELHQDSTTNTVPEPSALLAVVIGAGGLLLRRRFVRTVA